MPARITHHRVRQPRGATPYARVHSGFAERRLAAVEIVECVPS